jgi:hypothetical protein
VRGRDRHSAIRSRDRHASREKTSLRLAEVILFGPRKRWLPIPSAIPGRRTMTTWDTRSQRCARRDVDPHHPTGACCTSLFVQQTPPAWLKLRRSPEIRAGNYPRLPRSRLAEVLAVAAERRDGTQQDVQPEGGQRHPRPQLRKRVAVPRRARRRPGGFNLGRDEVTNLLPTDTPGDASSRESLLHSGRGVAAAWRRYRFVSPAAANANGVQRDGQKEIEPRSGSPFRTVDKSWHARAPGL